MFYLLLNCKKKGSADRPKKHNIASSVLTMMMKISNYNDLLYNNNYKYLLLIELIYLFFEDPSSFLDFVEI